MSSSEEEKNLKKEPPIPPRPSVYEQDIRSGQSMMSGYPGLPTFSGYNTSYMHNGSTYPYSYGLAGTSTSCYTPIAQQNSIVRMAEESSRPAFQSVESVVQTFASVSMMLESCYSAVHNSFRAILGVVDQFSRVKTNISHIISSLNALFFLKWLYRKCMVLLRLKPANYASNEFLWQSAQEGAQLAAELGRSSSSKPSGWSGLMFFSLFIGGPLLIWKLLSNIAQHVENSKKWAKGEGPHYEGRVVHTFNGIQHQNELSLEVGTKIRVAPKELQPAIRGWVMGSSLDGEQIGLIPMNHIEITGKVTQNQNNQLDSAFNCSTS